MKRTNYLGLLVTVLGVLSLVVGAVFVTIAMQKNSEITSALREQQVTLGLSQTQVAAGQVVDNMAAAQVAANTLNTHLKSMAPTFGALTAKNSSGRFDPTNPTNVDYAVGLTLEDSMNMAVMGFGIVQIALAVGITLIVIGVSIILTGMILFRSERKHAEASVGEVEYARSVAEAAQ